MKANISILFLFLFFKANYIIGQLPTVEWTKSFGESDDWNVMREIEVDSEGNIVCLGSYGDHADLDPGPGSVLDTATGGSDIFLLKLSPEGAFIWGFAAT
jgi:hypothetical protein